MSDTAARALTAAGTHDYGGPETRALLRMALDADHETGENCITSLARIHEAAGYAEEREAKKGERDAKKGARYRSAGRALKRFIADGAVRVDVDAPGIGRMFTVCPVGEWSGEVGEAAAGTGLGKAIGKWLRKHGTPDIHTSGEKHAPDPRTSGGEMHPGHQHVRGTPDTTPDATPDAQVSGDHRTNGPTARVSPISAAPDRASAAVEGTISLSKIDGDGEGTDRPGQRPLVAVVDGRRAEAARIVGILERGIWSIPGDDVWPVPTRAAIMRILSELDPPAGLAEWVAMYEVREIVQSHDRAPKVLTLFRDKLAEAVAEQPGVHAEVRAGLAEVAS